MHYCCLYWCCNYLFRSISLYPDFLFVTRFNFTDGLFSTLLVFITVIVISIFDIQHVVLCTRHINDISFHNFAVCICFVISYSIDYEKYGADKKEYDANKLNEWKVFCEKRPAEFLPTDFSMSNFNIRIFLFVFLRPTIQQQVTPLKTQ